MKLERTPGPNGLTDKKMACRILVCWRLLLDVCSKQDRASEKSRSRSDANQEVSIGGRLSMLGDNSRLIRV